MRSMSISEYSVFALHVIWDMHCMSYGICNGNKIVSGRFACYISSTIKAGSNKYSSLNKNKLSIIRLG